jgi:hypothetical protein
MSVKCQLQTSGGLRGAALQNVAEVRPEPAKVRCESESFQEDPDMHSALSILFAFGLVAAVFGLSFIPSTSLNEAQEEEKIAIRSAESASPGVDNTQVISGNLPGREKDAG